MSIRCVDGDRGCAWWAQQPVTLRPGVPRPLGSCERPSARARPRKAERHLFSQPRRQPSCWVRLVARLVARSGGQRWAWCDTRPLSKTNKPNLQNTYSLTWMLFTHALGPCRRCWSLGRFCVRDFTSPTPAAADSRKAERSSIHAPLACALGREAIDYHAFLAPSSRCSNSAWCGGVSGAFSWSECAEDFSWSLNSTGQGRTASARRQQMANSAEHWARAWHVDARWMGGVWSPSVAAIGD